MSHEPGRPSALAMDQSTFRTLGHRLVDQLAERLAAIPDGPVTRDESPSAVREALGLTGALPESGTDPAACERDLPLFLGVDAMEDLAKIGSGTP